MGTGQVATGGHDRDRQAGGSGGPARVSMLVAGAGPLVGLLHGAPTGGELWRGVLLLLATGGHWTVAPDLPGHHPTRLPAAADQSLTGCAGLIARWTGSDGGGPAWIVGPDIGGGLSQVPRGAKLAVGGREMRMRSGGSTVTAAGSASSSSKISASSEHLPARGAAGATQPTAALPPVRALVDAVGRGDLIRPPPPAP